jgi:hypothetical protein
MKKKISFLIMNLFGILPIFAAINCEYETAVGNGWVRTINIINHTNNTLQFNSWSPSGANPAMAWGPHSFKQIHSLHQGTVDIGVCCNDHKETALPLQLIYNVREGAKITTCTMNLSLICSPQFKLIQDNQSCDSNAVFFAPMNTHQVGFTYIIR